MVGAGELAPCHARRGEHLAPAPPAPHRVAELPGSEIVAAQDEQGLAAKTAEALGHALRKRPRLALRRRGPGLLPVVCLCAAQHLAHVRRESGGGAAKVELAARELAPQL